MENRQELFDTLDRIFRIPPLASEMDEVQNACAAESAETIARLEADKAELFYMLNKVWAAVNEYNADMEIALFKEIEFVLSKHSPKTA